jgi:hypothetical protein
LVETFKLIFTFCSSSFSSIPPTPLQNLNLFVFIGQIILGRGDINNKSKQKHSRLNADTKRGEGVDGGESEEGGKGV